VDLVRMLGFIPRRLSYYKLAFLPKSALQKHPSGVRLNNERLEYLGDAVLDAIVADYLYKRFPEGDEGFMTKLRARIVKRKTLNQIAVGLEIPALIYLVSSPGNKSKHVYGNALEALIGAIYIDRGYKSAKRFFIRKIMQKHIDLVQLVEKDPDYKSRVIEWAQKNRIEVVFESLEEHFSGQKAPAFISTISLTGLPNGTGRGGSKKEAEQQAAKKALEHIKTL
jgi:ribonuclease-3